MKRIRQNSYTIGKQASHQLYGSKSHIQKEGQPDVFRGLSMRMLMMIHGAKVHDKNDFST
jgi:hypothetical protein